MTHEMRMWVHLTKGVLSHGIFSFLFGIGSFFIQFARKPSISALSWTQNQFLELAGYLLRSFHLQHPTHGKRWNSHLLCFLMQNEFLFGSPRRRPLPSSIFQTLTIPHDQTANDSHRAAFQRDSPTTKCYSFRMCK